MARKKTTTRNDNGAGFEVSLRRAVRAAGWLLPTSEEAVAEDERRSRDGTLELPAELSDPLAALDPSRRRRAAGTSGAPKRTEEVDESLARAAREGKDNAALPPEVEERMKRDKEKARSKGE